MTGRTGGVVVCARYFVHDRTTPTPRVSFVTVPDFLRYRDASFLWQISHSLYNTFLFDRIGRVVLPLRSAFALASSASISRNQPKCKYVQCVM